MKKRNKIIIYIIILIIIIAIFATTGIVEAALTSNISSYSAQLETASLSIGLEENGNLISDDEALMQNINDDEVFLIGQEYEEELSVSNIGDYEVYARVIITKYWSDADGNKNTTLSPELIELNLTGSNWIIDEDASTDEQTVLYYTNPIAPGETEPFTNYIRINPEVNNIMNVTQRNEDGIVIYTMHLVEYGEMTFVIEVEVDAVQTHSAEAAILGAWGIDVTVSDDGTLSLN